MTFYVLTPPGTTVEVRTADVTRPILVSAAQLLAAGEVAAVLRARGLPCDLTTVLAMVGPGDPDAPAQQILPLEPPVRAAASTYGCVCGKFYDSELKLRDHQRGCGTHHQGFLIPTDHRI